MQSARCAGIVAFAAFILSVSAGVTLAQNYPSKPITLIIPWPAGGSTDVTVRAMGESASKHLGQPFIYDNKPGASGTLGPATMVAGA